MKETCRKTLKTQFYTSLFRTRYSQRMLQSRIAEKIAMDDQFYENVGRGNPCYSAVTPARFLMYASM